jgi:hypothetical protein
MNKASDSVDVPHATSLDLDTGFWIEVEDFTLPTLPGDALWLVAKRTDGSNLNYEMGVDTSGHLYITVVPMTAAGPTTLTPIYPTSGPNGNFIGNSCSGYTCVNNASDSTYFFRNSAGTKSTTLANSGFGVPSTAVGTCLKVSLRRWYNNQYINTTPSNITYGGSYSFDVSDAFPSGGGPTSPATKTTACHVNSANLTGAFVNSAQNIAFSTYNQYGTEHRYSRLFFDFSYTSLAAGTPVTATATTNLAGGVTHTLAGEYDGTTVKAWVDSVLEGSQAVGASQVQEVTDGLTILAASGTADYYRSASRVSIAASSASADVLDLRFFGDALTVTDAGDAGDGWTWEYAVSDQSAQANDGTWTLTASQANLSTSVGALSVLTGLPDVLISAAGGNVVGAVKDLNTSSSSIGFPGFSTISALIVNVGLPTAPLWFILLLVVGGVAGSVPARASKLTITGILLAMLLLVFGGAVGLYPWYYPVIGGIVLVGINVAMPMLGGRR